MPRKLKSRAKALSTKIPAEQLDLPVGFDPVGKLVTLREAMKPEHASVVSMASLSPEKRAELTVKRIEAQPKFELGMVGAGIVDKKRAIEEVNAQSDVGRVLMEIEQRVINSVLEQARKR
jgi:hypothetical protein